MNQRRRLHRRVRRYSIVCRACEKCGVFRSIEKLAEGPEYYWACINKKTCAANRKKFGLKK